MSTGGPHIQQAKYQGSNQGTATSQIATSYSIYLCMRGPTKNLLSGIEHALYRLLWLDRWRALPGNDVIGAPSEKLSREGRFEESDLRVTCLG